MLSYFLQQNAAIDAGTVSGIKINLKVLGVGDGLTVCLRHRHSSVELTTSGYEGPLVSVPWIHQLCGFESVSS